MLTCSQPTTSPGFVTLTMYNHRCPHTIDGGTCCHLFSSDHQSSKPICMGRTMSNLKIRLKTVCQKLHRLVSDILCIAHLCTMGTDLTQICTHTKTYAFASHSSTLVTCSQPTTSLGFVTLTIYNPMCLPIEGGTWGPPFWVTTSLSIPICRGGLCPF